MEEALIVTDRLTLETKTRTENSPSQTWEVCCKLTKISSMLNIATGFYRFVNIIIMLG